MISYRNVILNQTNPARADNSINQEGSAIPFEINNDRDTKQDRPLSGIQINYEYSRDTL